VASEPGRYTRGYIRRNFYKFPLNRGFKILDKIDNRFEIAKIVFSEKLLTAPLARKLVRNARRSGVRYINLTPEQFRRISRTEKASGVGAIAHQPWCKLLDISPNAGLCWVVVETVQSPPQSRDD
jgi:RNA methyltransferase, TrmH family